MSMQVIRPGIQTTIQDLGRIGYQQHGIVVSGAMDSFALRIANILVGNNDNASGLEMTLNGPALKWETDGWIAICGGDLGPEIDGVSVPLWRPIYVKRHSVLTFRLAEKGCRAYLAVSGGFAMTQLMNSSSTYLRGGIGGMEGRALLAGDILTFGHEDANVFDRDVFAGHDKPFYAATWFASRDIFPHYSSHPVVRIIKGPEFNQFTTESQHDLLHSIFTVSQQSDRMGFHLEGGRLHVTQPYTEMISAAVTMGTIQVPPTGKPIVLMADCQTTGGYPRIAHVVTVDLPLLAQVKPNERIQFVEVTLREAEELYKRRERDIHLLKLGVMLKRKGGKT